MELSNILSDSFLPDTLISQLRMSLGTINSLKIRPHHSYRGNICSCGVKSYRFKWAYTILSCYLQDNWKNREEKFVFNHIRPAVALWWFSSSLLSKQCWTYAKKATLLLIFSSVTKKSLWLLLYSMRTQTLKPHAGGFHYLLITCN